MVVKLAETFAAMLSGGSLVSWSATCAANTVRVQVSPLAKSAVGSIVKAVGPPVTTVSATLRVPLVGQAIWNQFRGNVDRLAEGHSDIGPQRNAGRAVCGARAAREGGGGIGDDSHTPSNSVRFRVAA